MISGNGHDTSPLTSGTLSHCADTGRRHYDAPVDDAAVNWLRDILKAHLLPAVQEEIPQDYQRPPSPQPQTVLSAAVWQALPQHPD